MKAVKKMSKSNQSQAENQNLPAVANNPNLPAVSARPAFLEEYSGPTGLENLKQYVVPPRLKIVQDQSGEQYKEFDTGTVLLLPQMSVVSLPEESFFITPIFQFTEFCVWNPWALKGSLNVIRERTFDPQSKIAQLSRTKDTWHQRCPEVTDKKNIDNPLFMLRYCEHINFICVLKHNKDEGLNNNPFVISFHHSGFYDGSTLSTLAHARRAPIFSGVYEVKTVLRTNNLGKWMGLQISNPSAESQVDSWNTKEDFDMYSKFFDSFADLHNRGEIKPDYEEEAEQPVADSKKF